MSNAYSKKKITYVQAVRLLLPELVFNKQNV